jgi:hypothetical protein
LAGGGNVKSKTAMQVKGERPKRRIWKVTVILVDRPSLIKGTKKQEKFLRKSELLRALKVNTGYAGVTPSVTSAVLVLS